MVQWLRIHARNAGASGSIPGHETRSYYMQKVKNILNAAVKIELRPGATK